MLKVYILARTTSPSTLSLSFIDVAVAVKTLGAKGPYLEYDTRRLMGVNSKGAEEGCLLLVLFCFFSVFVFQS